VGLLSSGSTTQARRAADALSRLAVSTDMEDRLTAAAILGESAHPEAAQLLLRLMHDKVVSIRHAAIRAAGSLNDPGLLHAVLAACDTPDSAHVAERALISRGAPALAAISETFGANGNGAVPRARWHSMIRVLGRIRDPRSVELLLSKIGVHDSQLRLEALLALSGLGYRSRKTGQILEQVTSEVTLAAWLAAALQILQDSTSKSELITLQTALEMAFRETRGRILLLLSFVYDAQAMLRARAALEEASAQHSPLALETVDAQLAPRTKVLVLPLLENVSHEVRLQRWQAAGLQAPTRPLKLVLQELVAGQPVNLYAPWTRLSAMHAAVALNETSCLPAIEELVQDPDPTIREMSRWSLANLRSGTPAQGDARMLSPVEKVLILKSAPLFGETPDNVLADVGNLVEEVSFDTDQIIFNKGEHGDSLYVIVSGSVKVWDGDRLLNELGEGEVFGELALLDPEPRLASVKAVEPTRVLRLDEAHFRQVLDSQPEVSAAIIRVVTRYLRSQLKYAQSVSAQLRALESFGFLSPAAGA
jgi:HEAT repeat protein